jgi:peptidyl-prolyl cis-trans isomerase C
VLAQLKAGADFAELARKLSTDPGARNGGDLGFFKQGDMVPEFAEVAFALKPGEVSPAPVHTQFGWHVIRVEERRTAPPPGFAQMEEELRRQLLQERVRTVVDRIRAAAVVERLDQPPPNPTRSLLENAAPPPAAPPAR